MPERNYNETVKQLNSIAKEYAHALYVSIKSQEADNSLKHFLKTINTFNDKELSLFITELNEIKISRLIRLHTDKGSMSGEVGWLYNIIIGTANKLLKYSLFHLKKYSLKKRQFALKKIAKSFWLNFFNNSLRTK